MKNVIVANFREDKSQNSTKQYSKDTLLKEIHMQIDNSLRFGWKPRDIVVVTNFTFVYKNIGPVVFPLNSDCLTGSKMFGMRELFRAGMVDDVVWCHDLDAWQVADFEEPEFNDMGIAQYSNSKLNGGSVLYRPSAHDIVEDICNVLETDDARREEPTIESMVKGKYSERATIVNNRYNVGCSGYVKRCEKSIKPIIVAHFHPYKKGGWDTHARDKNNSGHITVDDEFKKLCLEYYGDIIRNWKFDDGGLPTEVRDWSTQESEDVQRTATSKKES